MASWSRVLVVVFALMLAGLVAGCVMPVDGTPGDGVAPGGGGSTDATGDGARDGPLVSIEPVTEVPADFGEEVDDYWVAKMRYGDRNTYEVEVGRGHNPRTGVIARDEADMTWRSGVANAFEFTLSPDGVALLTVGNGVDSTRVEYGSLSAGGDVYLYVGVDAGMEIALRDLELAGTSLSSRDLTFVADETTPRFVRIGTGTLDLSGGFRLTGTLTFSWEEGAILKDERPTIVLKIPYATDGE